MPVPKRKRSKSRRDKRFANKGLSVKAISICKNCQNPLLSHQACLHCGFYKGVKVLSTKLDRTLKRAASRRAVAERKKQQQDTPQQLPEKSE